MIGSDIIRVKFNNSSIMFNNRRCTFNGEINNVSGDSGMDYKQKDFRDSGGNKIDYKIDDFSPMVDMDIDYKEKDFSINKINNPNE